MDVRIAHTMHPSHQYARTLKVAGYVIPVRWAGARSHRWTEQMDGMPCEQRTEGAGVSVSYLGFIFCTLTSSPRVCTFYHAHHELPNVKCMEFSS